MPETTPDRLAVVIPAYNEGSTVAELVAKIRGILPAATVVVVDDGSTDDTGSAATAAGAKVLRHPYNKGTARP